ncbi:subunit 17 of mediator complex-domain-containing protein [Naematelia encephala]|uniref:Mediator of RNA polymerase II transcription subunit 17 n=1 Tax=Naematelia encephala TaxID=71784 RepID=A0A1Y2AXQ7_9TREE|nr:subunit 17 of mediator complex-domain-containing protein [Naematelia encephala]
MSGSDVTPYANVKLSIDSLTLDSALGRGRLGSIEPDGTLVFEEDKTPQVRLTEQLARIWDEIPNGLLDLTEEKLLNSPQDDLVVNEKKTKESDQSEKVGDEKMLDTEGMAQMRIELSTQLNEARNELWFALELAKTLSLSSGFTIESPTTPGHPTHKKPKPKHQPQIPSQGSNDDTTVKSSTTTLSNNAPPILPPGTYSATPSRPIAPRPDHSKVYDLEIALAAKQKALEECSEMIDAAVAELQIMSDAGDRFWDSVKLLKDGKEHGKGQWAVVPRPDFGRTMVQGEKAKDIIIPYAVDEAPSPLRARSLAAFDLDPNKKDALSFGARGYHRLRLTLNTSMGSTSSTPVNSSVINNDDIGSSMEAAQLEVLDEEIFGEIRREATKLSSATVEPANITVSVGDVEIIFDMYDVRESSPSSPRSDLCDILLLSTRLLLLQTHRHRKRHLIGAIPPTNASPSILNPILQVLKYRELIQRIQGTLSMLSTALNKAGLKAEVSSRLVVGDEVGIASLTGIVDGTGRIEDLGGVISLDIQGFRIISINTSAPFTTIITTSQATFPLSDIEELPTILSSDISLQLLTFARDEIRRDEDRFLTEHVFVDELGGLVRLGSLGDLQVSFPAPYDSIYAKLERDDDQVEVWDPKDDSELSSWLHDLADRIND